MKACPECKRSFGEADEFCPHHGLRLMPLQAVEGGAGIAARDSIAAGGSDGGAPPAAAPAPVTRGIGQAEALIGSTIDGRYRVDALLGEGGMGFVYRAHHTVIEKTVAIKVLRREVARDASIVQRFLQEAKAASRIGHPNIVDVIDFGRLPEGPAYSVMEYIDGKTLAQVLKEEGRLPLARALPIVGQIARALGAAHEKGIVHRDLKPENIFLLERDGRPDFVKIVDFGIAKMAPLEGAGGERLTRAGMVFGTPEYMAPEQASGRSDLDGRVDVYALGTIFYEMLVGRVPFKGETPVATLAMQLLDPIVPPSKAAPELGLAPEVEAVVMKALAKERNERYGSMQELVAALETVSGGVPLEFMAATGSRRLVRETQPLPPASAIGATETMGAVTPPPEPRRPRAATPPVADRSGPIVRPGPGAGATILEANAGAVAPLPTAERLAEAERSAGAARARSRRLLWAALGAFVVAAGGMGWAVFGHAGGGDGGAPASPSVDVPRRATDLGDIPPAPGPGASPGEADMPPVTGPADTPPSPGPGASPGEADIPPVASPAVPPPAPGPGTSPGEAANPAPGTGGETPGASSVAPGPGHPRRRRADSTASPPPVPANARFDIVVRTFPAGGRLFVGGDDAGDDGTTFNRPAGERFVVRCEKSGYEPGRVTLVFDGSRPEAVCKMNKKAKCVKDLKNPFDKCKD